jgi:hypothetical protein
MGRKSSSKFLDPCQEAANKSIKCMHRNGGDKDMCQDYFQCVGASRAATSLALSPTGITPHTHSTADKKLVLQGVSRLQEGMGTWMFSVEMRKGHKLIPLTD